MLRVVQPTFRAPCGTRQLSVLLAVSPRITVRQKSKIAGRELERVRCGVAMQNSVRSLWGFSWGASKQTAAVESAVNTASTASTSSGPLFVPPPPEVDMAEMVARLGSEPSFADFGLGNVWSPSGLLQLGLEWVHNLGLPWWATVVALTVTIRTLLFPIYLVSRRAMIKMQNNAPAIQELNDRFTRARAGGNALETALLANELSDLMKSRSTWRAYLMMVTQMPTFITVFTALRGMSTAGVPTLQTGGLLWFQDLTVADPYFALPVLTGLTLLVTFELGAEGVRSSMMQGNFAKWAMRVLALSVVPFTAYFPSCMALYWFSNNVISLILSRILSLPSARRALAIPEMDTSTIAMRSAQKTASKGFGATIREAFQNARVGGALVDRARANEMDWRDAALKPAVRTFAENPMAKRGKQAQQAKRSLHTVVTRPLALDR